MVCHSCDDWGDVITIRHVHGDVDGVINVHSVTRSKSGIRCSDGQSPLGGPTGIRVQPNLRNVDLPGQRTDDEWSTGWYSGLDRVPSVDIWVRVLIEC